MDACRGYLLRAYSVLPEDVAAGKTELRLSRSWFFPGKWLLNRYLYKWLDSRYDTCSKVG